MNSVYSVLSAIRRYLRRLDFKPCQILCAILDISDDSPVYSWIIDAFRQHRKKADRRICHHVSDERWRIELWRATASSRAGKLMENPKVLECLTFRAPGNSIFVLAFPRWIYRRNENLRSRAMTDVTTIKKASTWIFRVAYIIYASIKVNFLTKRSLASVSNH